MKSGSADGSQPLNKTSDPAAPGEPETRVPGPEPGLLLPGLGAAAVVADPRRRTA